MAATSATLVTAAATTTSATNAPVYGVTIRQDRSFMKKKSVGA